LYRVSCSVGCPLLLSQPFFSPKSVFLFSSLAFVGDFSLLNRPYRFGLLFLPAPPLAGPRLSPSFPSVLPLLFPVPPTFPPSLMGSRFTSFLISTPLFQVFGWFPPESFAPLSQTAFHSIMFPLLFLPFIPVSTMFFPTPNVNTPMFYRVLRLPPPSHWSAATPDLRKIFFVFISEGRCLKIPPPTLFVSGPASPLFTFSLFFFSFFFFFAAVTTFLFGFWRL